MDYKRFSSHGHDNPTSDASIKRMVRHYPLKRNTWGTKKENAKSKALHNKKDA